MEILTIAVAAIVALLVLGALAIAFGHDSRDDFEAPSESGSESMRRSVVPGGLH
jgi:hypothetical protein